MRMRVVSKLIRLPPARLLDQSSLCLLELGFSTQKKPLQYARGSLVSYVSIRKLFLDLQFRTACYRYSCLPPTGPGQSDSRIPHPDCQKHFRWPLAAIKEMPSI